MPLGAVHPISVIGLLGLDLAIPDHTTLCRRAETLEVPRPRSRSDGEPVHLLVDSTGLKLCGAGEWLIDKHADDGSQVGPLLDQVDGPVASFTGDGGYDQEGVYSGVTARHPEAAVIVPPRSSAVLSETAETAPTQRDQHLQSIAEHGRMGWQKASGYNIRAWFKSG